MEFTPAQHIYSWKQKQFHFCFNRKELVRVQERKNSLTEAEMNQGSNISTENDAEQLMKGLMSQVYFTVFSQTEDKIWNTFTLLLLKYVI